MVKQRKKSQVRQDGGGGHVPSRDDYYTIYMWMHDELGLSGVDEKIFAVVYGFTAARSGVYFGGLEYLSRLVRADEKTCSRSLGHLVDRGLLSKTPAGRTVWYRTTEIYRRKETAEEAEQQLTLGGEDGQPQGAPEEDEQREYLQVMFFRNFHSPSKEVERFCAAYGSQGWCTAEGMPLDTREKRVMRAVLWNPLRDNAGPRFPRTFLTAWKGLYKAAPADVRSHMLDDDIVVSGANPRKYKLRVPRAVETWIRGEGLEQARQWLLDGFAGERQLGVEGY